MHVNGFGPGPGFLDLTFVSGFFYRSMYVHTFPRILVCGVLGIYEEEDP
jgi:hypothetical protein